MTVEGRRPRPVPKIVAVLLAFGITVSAVLAAPPPTAEAATGTISGRVTMPDGSRLDDNVSIDIFGGSGDYFTVLTPLSDTFSWRPWGPGKFYVRLSYFG